MKKSTWITLAVVAIALIGASYAIFARSSAKIAQPIEYQERTATKGDISVSFSADAVVQGEIVSITAPVSERITDMRVSVGTDVKQGQYLFSVDRTKLQYQYNATMATFSKAVYERNQIDKTLKPDSYSAAQQVVNSAYNQVQIAKLALDQTTVTSPIYGTIAEVNVHAGEYPSASQGAVLKIVKRDSLYISTVLDEAEIGKITKVTPVTISLDALGKKVNGVITSIAPMSIKDSAGYSVFPIVIRVTDKNLPLRVGFEGTVQFVTKTVKEVTQIPVSAVFTENSKTYVLKKTADGNQKQEVKTGFTDAKVVEITEGLVAGDIVLIKK